MPKYFVGATVTKYYSAEIEAGSSEEANHKFWSLNYDPDRGVAEHDEEIEEEIHTNFEVKEDG
tara:strand:- start:231 stop:419 length:189 start_codon:yes stop_codon:yes gene_type:complete